MSLMLFESNDKESKMNSSSSSSSGISLCGMVFIVFLFLKLAEIGAVATWSWWWVTSPLWIPFALLIGITAIVLAVGLLVMGICALLGKKRKPFKRTFQFRR